MAIEFHSFCAFPQISGLTGMFHLHGYTKRGFVLQTFFVPVTHDSDLPGS